MGKLNGMPAQLKALKAMADQQRIAQAFGIEPGKPGDDPVDASDDLRKAIGSIILSCLSVDENDEICQAIGSLGDRLEVTAEAQRKAISEVVGAIPEGLATDKGIAKALKAHATVIKIALDSVNSGRDDTAIVALLERVVAVSEGHQRMMALMMANKDEPEEEPETVRFDIERDRNGFMTSVIARH